MWSFVLYIRKKKTFVMKVVIKQGGCHLTITTAQKFFGGILRNGRRKLGSFDLGNKILKHYKQHISPKDF